MHQTSVILPLFLLKHRDKKSWTKLVNIIWMNINKEGANKSKSYFIIIFNLTHHVTPCSAEILFTFFYFSDWAVKVNSGETEGIWIILFHKTDSYKMICSGGRQILLERTVSFLELKIQILLLKHVLDMKIPLSIG